jgi:hypothetical protein
MNEFIASLQGANIRITDDGLISAIDLVMLATGKGRDEAGLALRRLKESQFSSDKFMFRTFPGKGSAKTKVITIQHGIELITVLPGKHIEEKKAMCTKLLSQYLEGDTSMADEIEENHSIGQKRNYARFAQNISTRVDTELASEMPESQYIYATKSAAFPGLIKIGRTTDMRARLSQLNTACAPAPHVLISIVPTQDMYRDELLIHEHFASSRKAGEFFEVQESEVKKYFRKIILRRYQKDLIASVQT